MLQRTREILALALMDLARFINPPRVSGVFLVDRSGHCWRV